MKSRIMAGGALDFFKVIGGQKKEPEAKKPGGQQKQGHGHSGLIFMRWIGA